MGRREQTAEVQGDLDAARRYERLGRPDDAKAARGVAKKKVEKSRELAEYVLAQDELLADDTDVALEVLVPADAWRDLVELSRDVLNERSRP